MSEPQLVSADPHYGIAPKASTPPPNTPKMGAAIPGTAFAGSAEEPDTRGVTFEDLVSNPGESMMRIGASLQRDLSDPKTWLQAGLMYFGPKVFNKAAPVIARATASATNTPTAVPSAPAQPGVLSRVASVIEPGDIGVVSPRLGRAVDLAQRVRGAVKGVPTAAPAEAPVAAAPPPSGESPAPTPQPSVSPTPASPVAMSPQRIQNELGLAARRAGLKLSEPDYQRAAELVTQGQSPTDAVKAVAAPDPAVKPKLSGAEFQAAQMLVQKGMAPDDAVRTVIGQRAFAARFGLPSSETVRTRVANRNDTGRWPE